MMVSITPPLKGLASQPRRLAKSYNTMGIFRRATLSLIIAAVCSLASHPARADAIVLDVSGPPGSLLIVNGDRDTAIERTIIVEERASTGWTVATREFRAVDHCATRPDVGPLHLEAGARMRVIAWTGDTCALQCAGGCRANVYLGPGTFRFAIKIVGGPLVTSPEFDLPQYGRRTSP